MTVLVTGGTGLVGEAIRENEDRGKFFFASSSDGDLKRWEKTLSLFHTVRPEAVIHLAARVGGLYYNIEENLSFLEENLMINMNVVKACHEFKIQNAVFCLSTCIFPVGSPLPLNESMIHEGSPHPSNEGYSHSKRILECLVRMYSEKYGYKWCCVIPTNLYGPHDNFDLSKSHVIPALIHKCAMAKLKGTDFHVSGTGRPVRQFLYSKDFARIVMELLRRNACGNFICCGDEPEITIADLARKIASVIGFQGSIQFDSSASDGILRKTACGDKLRSFLNDSLEFTILTEGLKDTVDWFMSSGVLIERSSPPSYPLYVEALQ